MTTGRFVWYDLMTTDPAAARAFYSALFGWSIVPHSDDYAMLQVGDRAFGGLIGMKGSDDHPPHWVAYVTTDDINGTTSQVRELGGKVLMQHKAEQVGELAIIQDRQGAVISSIQLLNEGPPTPPEKAPNFIAWAELHTTDPEDALDFYKSIFGWKAETWGGTYWLLGDEHNAGLLKSAHGHSSWLLYVNTENTDATTEKVKELGGQVIVEPTDLPDVGRFAVFADPVGAVFAVMQSLPRP